MPTGTCEVCACTELNACEGGCKWADIDRTICTQCAGWVLLKEGGPFAGIMPYNLWPVRTLEPVHTRQQGHVWPVDVRRMDAEQLERTAHVVAPMCGFTAVEFMDEVATGKQPFVMRGKNIAIATRARTADEAASHVEEWRTTGKFSRGLAVSVVNLEGERRG